MPAVVRVKRRIDEEPLSAFVLNGKKRRIDENVGDAGGELQQVQQTDKQEETISTVLKFAGTINEQDDQATKRVARLNKQTAQQLVKEKTYKNSNHTERSRQEMRQLMHENRFRVVNCMRSTLNGADDDAEQEQNKMPNTSAAAAAVATNAAKTAEAITIVDIEKQTNAATDSNVNTGEQTVYQPQASNNAQPADSDAGYVYDLYLPDDHQQAEAVDLMDDNYLSVHPLDKIIFEQVMNDESDEEYDTEDSNDENYFANDYPDDSDEEENMTIGELAETMNGFQLNDDDDDDDDDKSNDYSTSSDDVEFDESFVHSLKMSDEKFVDDVDACNADSLNTGFAHFNAYQLKKKQLLEKQKNDELDKLSDEDDEDGD